MQAYPERNLGKSHSAVNLRVCSACGAQAQRKFAKYCPDCGKSLWEDYQPLDRLRASYRLQGKNFDFENKVKAEQVSLFEKSASPALDSAWAFLVYAMVPYLGVLFIPGAFLMAAYCLVKALIAANPQMIKNSLACIFLSVLIFSAQILLWWLFYAIPEFQF